MIDYDRIMLQTRHNELEAMAERHRAWREARRELGAQRTRAPGRLLDGLRGLRSNLRRRVKRHHAPA
ncbi:MAG: hypothetical protein U5K81_04435 [Trueperaceae bacterium]|nr:hypothetical protein [Trueperaceae bacterium]